MRHRAFEVRLGSGHRAVLRADPLEAPWNDGQQLPKNNYLNIPNSPPDCWCGGGGGGCCD